MTDVISRPHDEAQPSPAEIENEIRRTRVELSLTLDALEYQLAPRQLIEKGVDMISQSLKANDAVFIDVGEALRANRMPLTLIGAGIAWLIAANLRVGEPQAAAIPTELGGSGASGTDRNGVWVHQAAGAARSVREAAGTVLERAGEYAEYARPVAEPVRRAGRSLRVAIEQRPFLVGLAGLICGAAVAALLPSTRREREWVGEARGEVWKRAEE
ncbi:MAG: DUF3618 domain-containing protein, partial [Alphaproteobacteria bacterium]|nr:DUF3618 domain-containing protein [Alphaproteobacteria bacterium]